MTRFSTLAPILKQCPDCLDGRILFWDEDEMNIEFTEKCSECEGTGQVPFYPEREFEIEEL